MHSLIVLSTLLLSPSGDVLDAGQGKPFPTIASAVAAASDGDTIRVFGGAHGAFVVHGKGLTILAQGPIQFVGTVRVQGLSAGQTVVVDGLEVHGQSQQPGVPPLVLGVNQGSVRIHDCKFDGAHLNTSSTLTIPKAARIVDSADVAFTSCQFSGGATSWLDDDDFVTEGGDAMEIDSSAVDFHSCWINGGNGFERSSNGGNGLWATDAQLYFQDCTVRGGVSSHGSWLWPAGTPGAAVILWRGHADFLSSPHDMASLTSRVILQQTATLGDHLGEALALVVPSSVRDDAVTLTMTVTGDPTDLVLLVDGTAGGRRDLPGFVGDLLVGGTVKRRFLGTGPLLSHGIDVPDVPSSMAESLHLQSVHLRTDSASPTGRKVIFGPVRSVTVLDAAL